MYAETNYNGNINELPESIFESTIICGDMNNYNSGLNKIGVYHYKNFNPIIEIKVMKHISDHNGIVGEIIIPETEY